MRSSRIALVLALALGATCSPTLAAERSLPIGTCINLGNTLEVGGERPYSDELLSKADIERIAAAGFTTVRIPVRWDDKSLDHPPYTVDPKWMARVSDVVDMALAAGLNVILNSHYFQPIYEKPLETQPWHTAVWQQIAAHFADRPTAHLWFEIENEPHDKFDNSNLWQVFGPALAQIRTTNPDRPVVIGGEKWSGINSLAILQLPDDPNLYPTFHYYDPFDFTHQGASWIAPNIPEPGRIYGTRADAALLETDVAKIRAYAARTGLMPFMGESGAYDLYIPLEQRVQYTKAIHDAFVSAGIPVCQWAYANTFPFYDRESGKWLPGMLEALGLQGETASNGGAGTSAPSTASDPNDPLAAIEAAVSGRLINDPTRIDWPSMGADLMIKGVRDEAIPGGKAARRYTVKRKQAQGWEAQTLVPLVRAIGRGQQVTIGFYARALSAETDDGKGRIRLRFQQNSAPWPGFGDTDLKIGPDWHWYEVSAIADRTIDKGLGVVSLQLGGAKQEIEIGQTLVVEGVPSIVNPSGIAARAAVEIPQPLQGSGSLVNAPAARNWSNIGPQGSITEREEPAVWLGKATRYVSAAAGQKPWAVQTSIPLDQAINEGDRLLVALVARTETSSASDGNAQLNLRVQGTSPPYDGFGDVSFAVGQKWQLIRIPLTASRSFATGQATLTLQFATQVQTVDIGPVYVFRRP